MEKDNIAKLGKPRLPRSAKNPTNCKLCDGHLAPKISTAKNHKIHYRQSTLSEYFPQQQVDKPRDEELQKEVAMVNFRKLVRQLLNAKVTVERLSQTALKAKQCPTLQVNIERLQVDPQQSEGQPLEDDDTKYALRYCYKCKTTLIDRTTLSAQKKCRECGTTLLFVCTKCRSNPYLRHGHMRRHRNLCDGKKSNALTSMQLYFCADCEFFTAYEQSINMHVMKTQHKAVENSKD